MKIEYLEFDFHGAPDINNGEGRLVGNGGTVSKRVPYL
jgi:hypothetical protein